MYHNVYLYRQNKINVCKFQIFLVRKILYEVSVDADKVSCCAYIAAFDTDKLLKNFLCDFAKLLHYK